LVTHYSSLLIRERAEIPSGARTEGVNIYLPEPPAPPDPPTNEFTPLEILEHGAEPNLEQFGNLPEGQQTIARGRWVGTHHELLVCPFASPKKHPDARSGHRSAASIGVG
jgi:hypothetical protein